MFVAISGCELPTTSTSSSLNHHEISASVDVDSSSIQVTREGDRDIITFSDIEGNQHQIEALYDTSDRLVETRQFLNGVQVYFQETYWHSSGVDSHVSRSPEGFWAQTGADGNLISTGGAGCIPGDPTCILPHNFNCGREWGEYGFQTARVVLATGAVVASVRPPLLKPNRLLVSWMLVEAAEWGLKRADLVSCLNNNPPRDPVDPV